jgi:cytochrome c
VIRDVVLISLLALSGCGADHDRPATVPGGNAERGRAALARLECNACHVIPGVRGAQSHVGPSLDRFSHRVYVAGRFANTPEVLVRWIVDPSAMKPGTAMPTLGVTEADAGDIAAYLYELE